MTDLLPLDFLRFLVFFTGLAFGSFVTLVSYRLPRGEKMGMQRSRCTSCQKPLGVAALVPLVSWIWQHGKCRYCGAKVHWRYPATELVQGLLFLWVFETHGLALASLWLMALSVALMVMIVVDFEWLIIPDECQIAMAICALGYHYTVGKGVGFALTGGLVGFFATWGFSAVYAWLRKKDVLGFGDVKFLGVAGMWLGWISLAPFLFYGGLIGVLTALVWRILGGGERFPFGPALAAALWISLLTDSEGLFYWTIHAFIP